jgi:hypothetical protein
VLLSLDGLEELLDKLLLLWGQLKLALVVVVVVFRGHWVKKRKKKKEKKSGKVVFYVSCGPRARVASERAGAQLGS